MATGRTRTRARRGGICTPRSPPPGACGQRIMHVHASRMQPRGPAPRNPDASRTTYHICALTSHAPPHLRQSMIQEAQEAEQLDCTSSTLAAASRCRAMWRNVQPVPAINKDQHTDSPRWLPRLVWLHAARSSPPVCCRLGGPLQRLVCVCRQRRCWGTGPPSRHCQGQGSVWATATQQTLASYCMGGDLNDAAHERPHASVRQRALTQWATSAHTGTPPPRKR